MLKKRRVRFNNLVNILVSPKSILSLTTVFIALLAVATILVALSLPQTSTDIRRYQDKQIQIQNSHGKWVDVNYFKLRSGKITASNNLAIEEPDHIDLYKDINQLLDENSQLAYALDSNTLAAVTANETIALRKRPRQLHDLPLRFWVVLCFSLISILIAGAVFAFGGWRPAVSAYIQNTLVYFLFTTSSNIYGTRQLIIDGGFFRTLHVLNHIGTLMGVATIMILLWVSPRPIHNRSITWWAYGIIGVLLLIDIFQFFEHQIFYFYTALILAFLCCLVLGMYQWWQVRNIPVDKAAMRWIVVSVMLPLSIFSLVYLIPVLLNIESYIAQGYMYGIILFINIGLGFGVLRYKVYELEQWWFSIWTWFLGGLSILVVDAILFTVLPISHQNGLLLSVALIGWLYFPMRQWAMSRINQQHQVSTDYWLPNVLPILLNNQLNNKVNIQQKWISVLSEVYKPLDMSSTDTVVQKPKILNSGQTLLVPSLDEKRQGFALHHASRGQRLFTKNDYATLDNITELTKLAVNIANARLHGARLERERLARDIHDDISARLLTILHQSNPKQKAVVQETLVELRNLLNQLDNHEVDLATALADWRLETSLRIEPFGVSLTWETNVQKQNDIVLTSNEYSNIRRIIREAITNALKYMKNKKVSVRITDSTETMIAFSIRNYGEYLPVFNSGKRGINNIAKRVKLLNGHMSYIKNTHYFELVFTIKPEQVDSQNFIQHSLSQPSTDLSKQSK